MPAADAGTSIPRVATRAERSPSAWPRNVIPNHPLYTFARLPKAIPIDYYCSEIPYNDLAGIQQTLFADASIVASSPDASQVLSNSGKHPGQETNG